MHEVYILVDQLYPSTSKSRCPAWQAPAQTLLVPVMSFSPHISPLYLGYCVKASYKYFIFHLHIWVIAWRLLISTVVSVPPETLTCRSSCFKSTQQCLPVWIFKPAAPLKIERRVAWNLFPVVRQKKFTVYTKSTFVSKSVREWECGMWGVLLTVWVFSRYPCGESYWLCGYSLQDILVCPRHTNHPDIWLMRGRKVGIDGMGKGNPEAWLMWFYWIKPPDGAVVYFWEMLKTYITSKCCSVICQNSEV